MSPLLIPMMALMIPITAIVGGVVVKPWFAYRHRRLKLEASMVAEKAAQYAARTEQLEQRVRVLERIVTDRGADLSFQIEQLRDPAPLN
jgi:alpha-D-ribose 1-methylphosphonate 5-triphosphate synthase subunit PhnI